MIPETINAVTMDNETMLHCAASGGSKKVCELLIQNMSLKVINAVTTREYSGGETALYLAILKGHTDICKLLIPKMSIEAINAETWTMHAGNDTALHSAAEKGIKDVCELILETNPEAVNRL